MRDDVLSPKLLSNIRTELFYNNNYSASNARGFVKNLKRPPRGRQQALFFRRNPLLFGVLLNARVKGAKSFAEPQ